MIRLRNFDCKEILKLSSYIFQNHHNEVSCEKKY